MGGYLPIALLAASGLICSVALLASRSPLLVGLTALGGTSLGLYLADRLGIPPNLLKMYLASIFVVAFVLLGRVPHFRSEWWEYLLLLFFGGRVLFDVTRPDFELLSPFGGLGDGLFLTSAYFYFKKVFMAKPAATERVLRAALYCTIAVAACGLIEIATGRDLFAFRQPRFFIEGRNRANSIFMAPEHFGAAMSLGIYLALLLYRTGRATRLATAGMSALLVVGMIACLYRGIWLAFVAGLVCLFVASPRVNRLLRVPLRLVASVLVLSAMGFSLQALLKSSAFYEQRIANPQNVDSRMLVYRAIVRGVAEHPWIGYGTGTVTRYLAVTPYNTTSVDTPHNVYLALIYENGIAFLAVYLGWFFALLWLAWTRQGPAMPIVVAAITMLLVTDLSMYLPLSSDYHSLLVIMMVGAAVAERPAVALQGFARRDSPSSGHGEIVADELW